MSVAALLNLKALIEYLKMHEWEDFEVKAAKNEVPKSATIMRFLSSIWISSCLSGGSIRKS